MTCLACTTAASRAPKQWPIYKLSCPRCAARLMLTGWALPAQRKALWAAIERGKDSPRKQVVQELIALARKSGGVRDGGTQKS